MLKTLLHLAVAVGLWFTLRGFDVGIPWRLGAIILGAIGVHLFWERFIFNPYLYLGVMHVPEDDPVMQRARERAKATFTEFLETLFPRHPNDSTVKFHFETSRGEVEYLWADLLEVRDNELKVYVRTPPAEHDEPLDRHQTIQRDAVIDWQVACDDGTILGGYTTRALFTIFEREEGYLHPKLRWQSARFQDLKGTQELT